MMTPLPPSRAQRAGRATQRGSVLLTAMLVATAMGLGLVSYLNLSRNALKLSLRTYYLNCAANLAEAGLEEAVYCYRLMDAGTAVTSTWAGWTLSESNASLTLPAFSLGQNSVGIVKVFVTGYDGTATLPSVISQATVTPLDGSPPVKKTLKVSMKKRGAYNGAIITSRSLSLGANSTVDSFNSNPTGSTSAERLAYPGNGATAHGDVIATGGSISLGSNAMVKGSALLAARVSPPARAQVSGSIVTNYTGTYPTPTLPNWSSRSGYYGLWSIPSKLPREGDRPAADGRYYYYPAILINPLTVTDTTIGDEKDVTMIVTSIEGKLKVDTDATCIVWTGNISTSGNKGLENRNWPGALQLYSWGSSISLGHNYNSSLCIYAPLATVTLNGGGSTKAFTGSIVSRNFTTSARWLIHYDESLKNVSTQVGTGWSLIKWHDLQGTAEIRTLSTLTNGFLN